MEREVVTLDQLRAHINSELALSDECDNAEFQSPIWWRAEEGPLGENWVADTLTFHGRSGDSECLRVFVEILTDAAQRLTVDWSGEGL